MTAAFILGINLFIAGIFAVAFGLVAATNRKAFGPRWIAAGYAVGMINIVLEYLLRLQSNPVPVGVAIFLTYLLASTLCIVGVARHYRFDPSWRMMGAIWGWSILTIPVIFTLTYASPLRVALYQFPYFAMQILILFAILRVSRLQRLDLLLVGVIAISALIHLSRPLIAWQVGISAAPQGYMATNYAAISQSLGAGILVAQALAMLLVMMRDTTAEIMARSETDLLSGLLNRRGFSEHGERAFSAAQKRDQSVVLIAADLDHFKAINDSFGHAAGDAVIAHFAQMLNDAAPDTAIISRPGGEEFAVLLIGVNLGDGRLYADGVRRGFAAADLSDLGVDCMVSASFGVAQMMSGDDLFDLWRRADAAMYRAKAGGRNRVSLALGELPSGPPTAIGATG